MPGNMPTKSAKISVCTNPTKWSTSFKAPKLNLLFFMQIPEICKILAGRLI